MSRSINVIFLFAISQVIMAEPNFKEGLWEITSTMNMANLPISLPGTTVNQCITHKDFVPQSSQKRGDCQVDHKADGNEVTWHANCKMKEGQMQGDGKITYQKETFSGEFVSEIANSKMGTMKMTIEMKGRHVGACN